MNLTYTVSTGDHDTDPATPSRGTAENTDGVDLADVDATGALVIPQGVRSGLVYVQTVFDNLDEADETFTLTLSGITPTDFTATTEITATGTIIDNNDPPSLSVGPGTGVEGNNVDFPVTLSPASGQAVTVNYATAFGTATSDDFPAKSGDADYRCG